MYVLGESGEGTVRWDIESWSQLRNSPGGIVLMVTVVTAT